MLDFVQIYLLWLVNSSKESNSTQEFVIGLGPSLSLSLSTFDFFELKDLFMQRMEK